MLFEARIAGVGYFEALDYTWGELTDMIAIYNERERRIHQHESTIAYRQAQLIASWVWNGDDTAIYEAFPYWNEAETREAELAKWKAVMNRHAANHISK